MSITVTALESPIGRITIAHTADAVRSLTIGGGAPAHDEARAAGREAADQLAAYFAGRLRRFDLPLEMGGTPFQRAVWEVLREIPFGETLTYGALAEAAGCPGGARAVGGANGANPIALIVPCHRVVAAQGLGGYGYGLECKRWLLDHERAVARAPVRA